MSSAKREQILFSCLGSTDPVRGLHDGAMLHIVRHYRPAKIFWYITKEMRIIEQKDNRYRMAIESLKTQYPDYEPEILEPYYDDKEDVSDFDGFYKPFSDILKNLTQQYPEAEILINFSSGTPQMKMTLALLSQILQFRIRGIQVKNFERRSGTSDRTTSQDYDLEIELALNEDAAPDAENRCSEPKLIGIQREKQRTQIKALLERYDYKALLQLNNIIPKHIQPLVHHLALRSVYDIDAAIKKAKDVRGIELYPALRKEECAYTYKEYRKLSEYLLMLKLMQKTQRYTDLVIRLNPFIIRLQEAWLIKRGINFLDLGRIGRFGEKIMMREKIANTDSELLDFLDLKYFGGFRDSPLNISFCNYLIENIGESESETGKLFLSLEQLNSRYRNESAHTLTNITQEDIEKELGFDSESLIEKLICTLKDIYPQHYQAKLFFIYDSANKKILNALNDL